MRPSRIRGVRQMALASTSRARMCCRYRQWQDTYFPVGQNRIGVESYQRPQRMVHQDAAGSHSAGQPSEPSPVPNRESVESCQVATRVALARLPEHRMVGDTVLDTELQNHDRQGSLHPRKRNLKRIPNLAIKNFHSSARLIIRNCSLPTKCTTHRLEENLNFPRRSLSNIRLGKIDV